MNLLGLPVCTDLYEGEYNEAGYWESAGIAAFHDRLLAAFGVTWHNPRLPTGWEHSARVDALLPEARATFEAAHPSETWVWKDPRTCVTLPFWKRVFDDALVMFVFRHPSPVVASLRARQGRSFTVRRCINLWELHTRSMLDVARGLPAVAVHYEDLVRDPANGVARLARDLTQLGADLHGSVAAAADSIRPQLRHHAESELALRPSQQRLLELTNDVHGCHLVFDPPELPRRRRRAPLPVNRYTVGTKLRRPWFRRHVAPRC